MTTWRSSAVMLVGALAIGAMSGCSANTADSSPVAGSATPTPSALTPTPSAPTESPLPQDAESQPGATEAFLVWLEASRVPEVDVACAGLAPELVDRMITELNAEGFAQVETCEEMITAAAELYRAFDQNADIDIAVESETETDAVLFVTYLASGDCGTIVMTRTGADWIITEQSQECAL